MNRSVCSQKLAPLFAPERFDWDELTSDFPWIRAMQGVPQNPRYHAEGDVWTHTAMVARALLGIDQWKALPPRERSLVFASALLHDVAKSVCTQFDETGVASSPNHARRGETMAREILEHGGIESYREREAVCKLVRHHGLPLWFLDKPDIERALVRASIDIRLDHVALLAEADVRGRACADSDNLLATIELFRETCRGLECYDAPRRFASDHARFTYFRSETAALDYAAFDDCSFTATLMCGLPGSGKDTWITRSGESLPVFLSMKSGVSSKSNRARHRAA